MTPGEKHQERRRQRVCVDCGEPTEYARCSSCRRRKSERGHANGLSRLALGGVPATLTEIGDALGVSRQRAQQIEAEALAKMERRLKLPRLDVLRGLAILGVLSDEIATIDAGLAFQRGQHLRSRAA